MASKEKKTFYTQVSGYSLWQDGDEENLPETEAGAIWSSLLQVAPCFLLSGMGMVASGALLEYATGEISAFQDVPALIILVPALLGLKGNLEMTLGARLGSHANQKELQGDTFWPIASSNVMAVQCQAITVGAAAAFLAIGENYIATKELKLTEVVLLAASSITAASLASFLLGCIMIGVVVLASRNGVDPDNITAPLAGTLGDFVTLGIVVVLASRFWFMLENVPNALLFLCILLGIYALLAVGFAVMAYKSKYTMEIIVYGWYPVLASMLLSNVSGTIAKTSVEKFETFALFQVVMNGAGGNLAAILAAKMSTDLNLAKNNMLSDAETKPATIAVSLRPLLKKMVTIAKTKREFEQEADFDPHCSVHSDWVDMREKQTYARNWMTVRVLTQSGAMGRFARMLFWLIVPGQILFAHIVVGNASHWSALPTPLFLVCFIAASLCQACVLMMTARTLVVVLWRKRLDPDNGVSPIVCGMGDLCGTAFMTLAFHAVHHLHGEAYGGTL